ncbi:MAG: hypothetical protein ACREJ2_11655 [Planctomycetota bacterium]
MRPISRALVALAAIALLSGCVGVEATRLGDGVIHPPTSPDAVAIYLSPAQVHHPYQQVALLDAEGDFDYTSEGEMFAKLRKKAAALGANGILLESVTEPTTGAKVAEWLIGMPANRRGRAIAIYVER